MSIQAAQRARSQSDQSEPAVRSPATCQTSLISHRRASDCALHTTCHFMQERQDRMEKEISELKKEINGVKKCADDASKKCIEIMRKEMADVVKLMSEDMNEIKTS